MANVLDQVAVPKAATGAVVLRPEAAVGTTVIALDVVPLGPLAVNVTDPVGPTPPLCVSTVAVNVTFVVVVGVVVLGVTTVTVGAALTVSEKGLDELLLAS